MADFPLAELNYSHYNYRVREDVR
jgi:ubiquitin carboxyl-terminal hydrolase 4/11